MPPRSKSPSRSPRTLADLGETKIIERIARQAGTARASDWPLAIGDDAALLRPRKGQDVVLSVDAYVEGVHFRFGRETPSVIGRRALAVNLSDLAAMGATPTGCLLSLSAPSDFPVATLDGIIRGLVQEGSAVGCSLVGGNLTRAKTCSLHITVVGQVPRGRALRRGRLQPGDELFVTGVLGAGALARHRADRTKGRLRYVPASRIEVGKRLARSAATTGCIDLSDGLVTDLPHLLEGTRFGAEIDVEALPAGKGFRRGCAALGLDPLELQVSGGEDYELLFALRSKAQAARMNEKALGQRLGVPVTRIGVVSDRGGLRGLPSGRVAHHF